MLPQLILMTIHLGAHVLLGPTVNIQRSPLGGRGFESYSEDPFLSGSMARSFIKGLQSEGVAATIKHYVTNDSEFERNSMSCESKNLMAVCHSVY